jgi:GDP-mannose 6-dehydrogenase
MPRSISVFGLGYVGSVSAACFAHKGNRVLGVDLNRSKVEALNAGRSPIVEAKLEELVAEAHKNERLKATTDTRAAVLETEISLLCVGTPSQRNGKLDMSGVERVCEQIGEALREKKTFHWIVLRSTVLPGTTEKIVVPALEKSSGKKVNADFGVCFHPEFLREGTAVADFFEPPFTVIGSYNGAPPKTVRELYHWAPGQVFETSPTTAEMVKYMCNAYHAVKVSFANEIGTLCREMSVDTQAVTDIFLNDTRLNISAAYLRPGFAFGGSCLPKDLRALTYRSKELDLQLPLLEAIMPSNTAHIERTVETILKRNKRKVGILGLSFKSGTDDLRESPLVHLVKRLLGEGCECKIWDENVALGRLIGSNRQFIEETIPHIGSLLCPTMEETVESADVVVIGTKIADREALRRSLKPGVPVLDLVNLDKEQRLRDHLPYEGICW